MESRPHYDTDRHTLLWCGVVIKQFRRPAKSQHSILEAFEKAGWPLRIDEPHHEDASSFETDLHRRRGTLINDLNRLQHAHVRIHFHADETGHGIRWKIEIA